MPVERREGVSPLEAAARRTPLIFTDLAQGWPARERWTFERFRAAYGDTRVQVQTHERSAFLDGARVESMALRELIDAVLASDFASRPLYLRDWVFWRDHPELTSDYRVPPHFRDWFRLLPRALRLEYPRIYVGPDGAVSSLHSDIWGTHAWMTQLQGSKRWLLFAPDQAANLHGLRCDPLRPDLARFPGLARAAAHEGVIGPGETIFVPSGWLHCVESIGPTISLTYNFMGPGCLARSTREAIGAAWRARRPAFRRPRGAQVEVLDGPPPVLRIASDEGEAEIELGAEFVPLAREVAARRRLTPLQIERSRGRLETRAVERMLAMLIDQGALER